MDKEDPEAAAGGTIGTGGSVHTIQGQAVACWMQYLEQLRLQRLAEALRTQDLHLGSAIDALRGAREHIASSIIATHRGGKHGMHGFIAEVAEVGIGNARRFVQGAQAGYELLNDNGPTDLLRDGMAIQQKFSAAGGRFSLGAAAEHLRRYPQYLAQGGSYLVPQDHHATIVMLLNMPAEEAGVALSRSGTGPSWGDWCYVQEFFRKEQLSIYDIHASQLRYDQVQTGAYEHTLAEAEAALGVTDRQRRRILRSHHQASFREAASFASSAAAAEALQALIQAIRLRHHAGHPLSEFSSRDWQDVLTTCGLGFIQGGARGAALYSLRHFVGTSAQSAQAVLTASLGVAQQAHLLRQGHLPEAEFLQNCQLLCLEAALSAISSFMGAVLIPLPILGSLMGTVLGAVLLRIFRESLTEREQRLVVAQQQRITQHQQALDQAHQALLDELAASMEAFIKLLDLAFSPDRASAWQGSIALAHALGVPTSDILDTAEKTSAYFLD